MQTNQLYLTLIDPNAHYDLIPVKKLQTISKRINNAGIIAACHCGAEYESDYSKSINTQPFTSIDTSHSKSTDDDEEKSVDTYPDEWENDYYNPIIAVNDAPPETPDDPYDVEYIKQGILVYEFRPMRPEIQHKWKQISFLQKPVERELS